MHCIAHVRIPAFYCRTLGEGDSDHPCVVYKGGNVIDANDAAVARGVPIGMSLAEAKVLLQGNGLVLWKEETFREASHQWLDVCADFTDALEPAEQDSAFVDLSSHPNPAVLIEALTAQLGDCQIGVAGCKWLAVLAARLGDPQGLALVTPRRYVAPLPTDLLPVSEAARQRLKFLGYRTIGEIARLDFSVLRKQFEEEAFEIRRAAFGGGNTTIEALYPPDSLSARFAFDGPPETIDTLIFGLSRLADLLGKELECREVYGERLELITELESGAVQSYLRKFTKPFSSAKSLLTNLRLLAPSEFPAQIIAIRARAYDLRRSKRVQMDFQGNTVQRDASAKTAINHVRAVFGNAAITTCAELYEPRRVKVLRAWGEVNGWK